MKTLMRNGRDRRSENPFLGHAKKERVGLFGTDQRITSGPAARRPHSKAEYMTAPERFADSQIPLAPRAPSIHDPERSLAGPKSRTAARPCLDPRQSAMLSPWLGASDAIRPPETARGHRIARRRCGMAARDCPRRSVFARIYEFAMDRYIASSMAVVA